MTQPVWDKGGTGVNPQLQQFLAGHDVLLDRQLMEHDIAASTAHVNGLGRIGVLNSDEVTALRDALAQLLVAWRSGAFVLDERFEDGHSAVEWFLTEKLGDVGRKVHTGRSRNDQVLVALRLWLKEQLATVASLCVACGRAALARARRDQNTPMPGYTHMQPAVPSSVGLWMAGHAEGFAEAAHLCRAIAAWADACPLGTAAGYGVNLPLDRQGVADELGFARLLYNPLAAQNSRGAVELQGLSALANATLCVRRLCWDLSLFTTAEVAFVSLPEAFTTGSSIMPNKRNPDGVELLRTLYAGVAGAMAELQNVLSLPSGYQRDLQATKGPVMRAFGNAVQGLGLVPLLLEMMELHPGRMRLAIGPEMYATDRAVELAVQGVPFREAYVRVGKDLAGGGPGSPEQSLAARVSPGATARLCLDELQARLDAVA